MCKKLFFFSPVTRQPNPCSGTYLSIQYWSGTYRSANLVWCGTYLTCQGSRVGDRSVVLFCKSWYTVCSSCSRFLVSWRTFDIRRLFDRKFHPRFPIWEPRCSATELVQICKCTRRVLHIQFQTEEGRSQILCGWAGLGETGNCLGMAWFRCESRWGFEAPPSRHPIQRSLFRWAAGTMVGFEMNDRRSK